MPAMVAALGAAAAWGVAPFAGMMPLLWVALLLMCLAVPPSERRFFDSRWLVVGVVVLAVSWTVALDHELAFQLGLVFLTATILFGLARRYPLSDGALLGLALAIAATAIVAVAQVAGGLEHAERLVVELPPPLRRAAAARLATGRAFGTASLPGHFAALLLLALPLLVEAGAGRRGLRRLACWGAAALIVVSLVMTRSLAAFAVLGVLVFVAVSRRRRALAWLIAGAAAVVALGATIALRGDLGTLEPLALRMVNWRTALWAASGHPWLGVGLGGIGQAGLVGPDAAANITPFSHDTYLQLAGELGLAGSGLLVAGVASLAGVVWRGLRGDATLALAVAVLPLHNLVDFSAYMPEVLLPWAVLAGTLTGRTRPLPGRPLSTWLLVPVLAAGTLAGTLSWRGQRELDRALLVPGEKGAVAALAAARWTPWEVTPVLAAADKAAPSASPGLLATIDQELAERAWVRPASAAWAEARARLALQRGRPDEALVWAREARRRAPARTDLRALEAACGGRS